MYRVNFFRGSLEHPHQIPALVFGGDFLNTLVQFKNFPEQYD
jgi:hypothetical protein